MSRVSEQLIEHLSASNGLRELIEELLQTSMSLLNADFGNVQIYNPATGDLNIAAQSGVPDQTEVLHGTAAAIRRVMETRERLIVEDAVFDPIRQPNPEDPVLAGFRAAQFTPWVSRNGELLGVISSHFRRPYRPSDREVRLLDLYARQAAEVIQHKTAELALHASEQRFRSLVESLPAAVYTCDASGRVTLFNQAAVDLWGRKPEINQDQWCGSFKRYRPDGTLLPVSTCPLALLLRGEDPGPREEVIIERPDGSRRDAMAYPKLLLDGSGKLTGAVNMILDITDYKSAQQALRRSEDRFRRYFELGLIGMATTSPAKGILEVNDELCRILGYERGELLQKTWCELTHPDDLAADVSQFDRLLSGQIDGYILDKRWIRKDGAVIDSIMSANCLRLKDGSVDYVVGLVLDITERKRAEAYLSYHAQLLANVHDAILATDDKLNLTAWNRAAEEIYAWKAEEVLGRNVLEVIGSDISEAERERACRLVQNTGHYHVEAIHRSHNGNRLHIEGDAIALHNDTGRVTGYVATLRDLTARKQTEEELRKVRAELAHVTRLSLMGELGASIAHEINQPLGAIVNNANACLRLLNQPVPLQEIREVLSDIVADSTRASAIIARLRRMVKRATPEKERFQIEDMLRDVLALSGPELAERGITVRNELPDLPAIMGDRVQIQQLFLNLVTNGIDAMASLPDSRRILTIGGQLTQLNIEPAVLITVHDLGCGFLSDPERVFDAFYTTKPSGLGLGLRIARSIAEAHGGKLWTQANPDYGATFSLCLPCERTA